MARVTKTKITFKNVMNEGQLDHIAVCAKVTGCNIESKDCGCTQIITGTEAQIKAYIKKYNA